MEFYRIYHNYMRPRMELDGMTPAEAAEIYLGLRPDRLGGLIKLAFENERSAVHKLGARRLAKVDVSNDGKSITVRPKEWLGKEMWMEITEILGAGGFSWLSNGKESCWLMMCVGAA